MVRFFDELTFRVLSLHISTLILVEVRVAWSFFIPLPEVCLRKPLWKDHGRCEQDYDCPLQVYPLPRVLSLEAELFRIWSSSIAIRPRGLA